jgi:nicotinamidase-related amidase
MNKTHQNALCDANNAVLLVIDPQDKILRMAFDRESLQKNLSRVMRLADLHRVPVVLTEQYPAGLGPTVPELRKIFDELRSSSYFMEKKFFGCCGEPGFDELLQQVAGEVRDRRSSGGTEPVDIVVAGIESHICVQQTVLGLLEQGYRVVVLQDCTGGRFEQDHRIAMERFRKGNAVISSFESLAFEWTRSKDHPAFKQVSALVRE